MAKDLKQYLDTIERKFPDRLLRIKSSINPQKHEITALLTLLEKKGKDQIVLFENPFNIKENSRIPFVSNVFCSRGLCALALGLPYENHGMGLVEEFGKRERQSGRLEIVSNAPCQQVVWEKEDVDLSRLPVPLHHKEDVGPYFTMTCVMKGMEKEFYDISFTKNWVKEPRKMSVSAHKHHHLARIIAEHEKKDLPTPMIVVLGHHPAFYLSSCCLMPYKNNDYLTASAFLEEPLRLTPSRTWGEDFMVPADAEIIVETEVLPGIREPQNPFGEIAGYYQPRMQAPVAEVTAVTMKKDPIMQGVFPGRAEHWHLGGIPKEGSVLNVIRKKLSAVKAVHLPPSGCARFSCVISIQKESERDARRAAMMAFTEFDNLKMAIIVDQDVDVYDEREVQWAVVTRTHWDKDIEIIRKVQTFRKWLGDAVVIIDATRPAIPDFPTKNEIPPEAIAAVSKKGLI